GNERKDFPGDTMRGGFLGLEIASADKNDDAVLKKLGAVWQEYDDEELSKIVAQALSEGKIVGVARGAAEFGPRALGNRSILADARLQDMQSRLNLKIKFREGFRPFAPMVLKEDAQEYFEIKQESPYMLFCYPIVEKRRISFKKDGLFGIELLNRPRSDIPAVTHIDYSARVQTVDEKRNPFCHDVIK